MSLIYANGVRDEQKQKRALAIRHDPIFQLDVPETCPGVPTEMLRPENQDVSNANYPL